MTFTNRVGQDIMIKLNSEDEPKILHASDSRVSFIHRRSNGPDELQVSELTHGVYLLTCIYSGQAQV